jgi:nucleoside-specific outer membrane channel protein Tsx
VPSGTDSCPQSGLLRGGNHGTVRSMSRRSLVLLLLAAALGLRALPVFSQESPASDSFLLWSDNSVSALFYGWGFEVDPSEQSTMTLEHAHASRIGDLFMFVDFAKFHDVAGGADDTTWYGEFGPRFSFGKMLGKDLSHTFFKRSLFEFKDVLLAAQYERGEDPDVAEAVLLGVGVDLDVREAGILGGLARFNFLQLNFYARRELTAGADSSFNDAQITMVGSYPFSIGKVPFLIWDSAQSPGVIT